MPPPQERKSTSANKDDIYINATAEISTQGYNQLNKNKEAESNDTHVYSCVRGIYKFMIGKFRLDIINGRVLFKTREGSLILQEKSLPQHSASIIIQ